MDLQAGSKVGDYTLESYLGGGSFGAVWRARSEAGDFVAVKLLTGALSSADTSRRRADIEMLAAAAVGSRSDHVVKVLGSGDDPLPYIVMEYVEGGDLSSMLKGGGVLPASKVIDVGIAIMDALSALNEAGIFHRDIKPANVMVDQQGVIKLADFGIAKIVGYESITMTGQAAMTMAYAAPEVWDEDGSFGRPSHRSDLYAAGVVLYQCLAGTTPFNGNYGALYKAHAERAPDLALLPASTPPSLRTLIERCLEKRQADRPADAAACLPILRRAYVEVRERSGEPARGEPVHFGPWRKESPHPTQPWAWRCRHESTGEPAVVELHFVDNLERGAELRRLVEVNERLAPLGAERLLGTSRMLLAPGEAWQAPPAGQFQFWLAREDKAPALAKTLGLEALKAAARSLNLLMETAERERVSLSLKDALTVTQNGTIYLLRPGLVDASEYTAAQAFSTVGALPLNPEAREFADSARDFQSLVRLAGEDDQATRVVATSVALPPAVEDPTIVTSSIHAPPPPPAPAAEATPALRPEVAVPVQLRLRRLSPTPSATAYELLITNPGASAAQLRLEASSWEDRLRLDLPSEANVAPGVSQTVKLGVFPRQKRWFGGRRRTGFTIVAAAGGAGGGSPPVSVDGEFEEEPSRAPLLAGGGVFGIAALAVVAALALSGGGGDPQLATDEPATATATASPTLTPVPPTATPEPPTPTPEPPPPPPPAAAPAVAPTSTPRPFVPAPTATAVPYVGPPAAAPAPAAAPVQSQPVVVPTATTIPQPTAIPTCPPEQTTRIDIGGPFQNVTGQCR